jgi:hypothetical protein
MKARRFGRASALALAGLLVATGAVYADQLQGDTDALSTAAPHANGLDATQTVGTTVSYDYSAHVKETGNANDDVFPGTVEANVSIVQNDLGWSASVGGALSFTAYDQNQAGLLSVTVPAGTADGTINHIKVKIEYDATASDTNDNNQLTGGNASVVLNYNIEADAPVGCSYTASFLAPLDQSTPSNFVGNTFKRGRVLPVKAIVKCNGAEITPATFPGVIPWISVQDGTFVPKATDAVETFSDAGSSSNGTADMRFQSDGAGSGFWLFNLDTASQKVNSPYVAYVNVGNTQIATTFVQLSPTK